MKNPIEEDIYGEIITDTKRIDFTVFTEYAVKKFIPVTFNRTLYIYNHETKLYEEDTGTVKEWIQKQIEEAIYADLLPQTHRIQGDKMEVYNRIIHSKVIPGTVNPFNKYNGLPVNNCVLVFDEAGNPSPEEYKPEMLFTHKIPIDYDSEADMVNIINILQEWVGDNYNFLIQIPAQAIVQSLPDKSPMRKSYLLAGEASSGKTTYLSLLERLFGSRNISSIGLHNLGDRFNTCSLEGKYINAADDIPGVTLNNADVFKTLTGRRLHDVEPKGKPRYTTDLTAVHVYTANRPPLLDEKVDRDDAWWDRWILLRFPKTFKKIAGWNEEHLNGANLKGFLKAVVLMASKMISGKGVILYEQDMEEVCESWRHEASPLNEFLEEHTEVMPEMYIRKDEFFDSLWDWVESYDETPPAKAERRNRTPRTTTALTQKLLREGIISTEVKVNKSRLKVYRGIRWNPSSIYNKVKTEDSRIV